MKNLHLVFIILGLASTIFATAQQDSAWTKLNLLSGDWIATGEGQPGQGSGTFSFHFDLAKKILVRKSRTEYPAVVSKPGFVHEDLMIIYANNPGDLPYAIYFDSEGHTINYKIQFFQNEIQFVSDRIQNAPRFRLTYTFTNNKSIMVSFDIAAPQSPDNFKTYVKGSAQLKS